MPPEKTVCRLLIAVKTLKALCFDVTKAARRMRG